MSTTKDKIAAILEVFHTCILSFFATDASDALPSSLQSLDVDINGRLTITEVRGLFAKLLGIPASSIPDDDEELVHFVQLDTEAQNAPQRLL